MKAILRINDPDSIEFTLTVTMPLREWKRLREQLKHEYPAFKLSDAISEMVKQASIYYSEDKETDVNQ
jgi:hypothetical protein